METTVVDNGDGSYNISYTPKEPGVYSVWVCVKAQHVKVQKCMNMKFDWAKLLTAGLKIRHKIYQLGLDFFISCWFVSDHTD